MSRSRLPCSSICSNLTNCIAAPCVEPDLPIVRRRHEQTLEGTGPGFIELSLSACCRRRAPPPPLPWQGRHAQRMGAVTEQHLRHKHQAPGEGKLGTAAGEPEALADRPVAGDGNEHGERKERDIARVDARSE